jgi:hypothetical protein
VCASSLLGIGDIKKKKQEVSSTLVSSMGKCKNYVTRNLNFSDMQLELSFISIEKNLKALYKDIIYVFTPLHTIMIITIVVSSIKIHATYFPHLPYILEGL